MFEIFENLSIHKTCNFQKQPLEIQTSWLNDKIFECFLNSFLGNI